MKVAVAVTNNMVTEHFGHCEYFVINEISENQVKGSEILKNPPHEKGYLPHFLKKRGIDTIICGNMGEMACQMFADLGITVFRGVSGDVEEVITKFLSNTLTSSDVICREHLHHNQP